MFILVGLPRSHGPPWERKRQLVQDRSDIPLGQPGDQGLGRERLEPGRAARQVGAARDQVEVVLENYISVDLQAVSLGQVVEGIEEYLDGFGASEDRYPVQHCAGQEMGLIGCCEVVAASAHRVVRGWGVGAFIRVDQGRGGVGIPTGDRGNEARAAASRRIRGQGVSVQRSVAQCPERMGAAQNTRKPRSLTRSTG